MPKLLTSLSPSPRVFENAYCRIEYPDDRVIAYTRAVACLHLIPIPSQVARMGQTVNQHIQRPGYTPTRPTKANVYIRGMHTTRASWRTAVISQTGTILTVYDGVSMIAAEAFVRAHVDAVLDALQSEGLGVKSGNMPKTKDCTIPYYGAPFTMTVFHDPDERNARLSHFQAHGSFP